MESSRRQEPREPLHVHENIVFPPADPHPEAGGQLEAFLDVLQVNRGKRPAYAAIIKAFGKFGHGLGPSTLAELLRAVDVDTRHAHYGAFSEKRAQRAHHDTVKERRRLLNWLRGFAPKLVLVDAATSRRSAPPTLKAALATRRALAPGFACRISDSSDPVGDLRRELNMTSISLPFVTAGTEPLALDTILEAATRMEFDHFAVVDPLYLPTGANITIEWTQPASMDTGLSFADNLHRFGTLVTDGLMRMTTLRINSELYFALGPTRKGKFYMQRLLPAGRDHTQKVFLKRVRAVDEIELGLQPWSIERLRIAPRAKHAHVRVSHANVMAHCLSLLCNPKEAEDPAPSAWTNFYQAWDLGIARPDGEA